MTAKDKIVFVIRWLMHSISMSLNSMIRGGDGKNVPSSQLRALNDFFRGRKAHVSSAYDPITMRIQICKEMDGKCPGRFEDVGAFRLEWRGDRESRTLIFAVPGGGFFLPPLDHHRNILDRFCQELGAQSVILHHRLSPEHKFPAAYEDVLAAFDLLSDPASQFERIFALADSSGGALLLAAMMTRRDRGLPLPNKAVLISAATDFAMTGLSNVTNAENDPMVGPEAIIHKAFHYLNGANPTDVRVSPYWGEAHALPPLLMFAGSTEVMLDDTQRFAEKVRKAGGFVTTLIYPKTPHCFVYMDGIPEAESAFREICSFFRAP